MHWIRRTLQDFISTLMTTTESLGNFSLIVLLVVFIYALLGMQVFGGNFDFGEDGVDRPRSNFDTLLDAIMTVFQILTGEDWNKVIHFLCNNE